MRTNLVCVLSLVIMLIVSGCGVVDVPSVPELPEIPEIPDIPGLPQSFDELADQVPGLLEDLELPDLSQIPGLPELSDLPGISDELGVLTVQGPTERSIAIGEQIPGTDIQLASISDQGAIFRIAGLNAQRSRGDSLDFDGPWPGVDEVDYTVRLRVYYIGTESVRAAGVHRMIIRDIQPVAGSAPQHDNYVRLPFSVDANNDQRFKGMTLGYIGSAERGAEISGLAADEFPFRKIGDSILWEGTVRPDIPVRYNARLLFYSEQNARIGGTVSLYLPGIQN